MTALTSLDTDHGTPTELMHLLEIRLPDEVGIEI